MIGLLWLSYTGVKGDLFHPSCVICASFAISIFCCIYNVTYWDVDLSWSTYGYIIGGTLIYVLTSFLIEQLSLAKSVKSRIFTYKPSRMNSYVIKSYPDIQEPIIWIMIAVVIFVGCFYLAQVFSVAGQLGSSLSDWNHVMATFRRNSIFGVDINRVSLNRWISWIHDYAVLLAYPASFCLARDLLEKKSVRSSMLILVLSCGFVSMFEASRITALVGIPLATAIYYVILWHRKNGWHRNISPRILARFLVVFIIVLFIFFLTGSFVGRNMEGWGGIYYITYYLGGNIIAMDLYLKNPIPPIGFWGAETFYGFYTSIGKAFNISELKFYNISEFRYSDSGKLIGNLYPIYRRFLADFGMTGFVIGTILLSVLLTKLYIAIRKKKADDSMEMDLLTLWYGQCFLSIAMVTMVPSITARFTTFGALKDLLFFIVAIFVFNRLRFTAIR